MALQDLAALLPNLSQIRRPSKFAIINSSIAYIYASRELRILKLESDALRRELNEWRDWAGLRVDEPVKRRWVYRGAHRSPRYHRRGRG